VQPIEESTSFRIRARVEEVGPEEYVAIARAIPDNGDSSRIQSLTRTASSRNDAREAVIGLVARLRTIVAANGGRVTDIETAGL
jgi:hypothetical protein